MALVWESSGSLGGVFLEQEKEWSEIKGAMLLGEVSQMLKALTDILASRASRGQDGKQCISTLSAPVIWQYVGKVCTGYTDWKLYTG